MELKLYGEEKIRIQIDHQGDNFIDVTKMKFDDNGVATFYAIDCDVEVWHKDGMICVASKKHRDVEPYWYESGKLIMRLEKRKR